MENNRGQVVFVLSMVFQVCSVILKDENCVVNKNCPTFSIPNKPNIIILVADDMGYGDLSSYGHPSQQFNRIDQMAKEGLRFTQFYSADSLCTPSRAGLLTGRLPIRSGMVGDENRVLLEGDMGGLPSNETTIPEILKSFGYYTGMVGKWHLGINAYNHTDGTHLPSKHGFEFVGRNLPMTNLWHCDETGFFTPEGPDYRNCFLYDGDTLYQQPIKFETLTSDLVDGWRQFLSDILRKEKETKERQPFFFYLPFPHVHDAQWASKAFKGKANRGTVLGSLGLYGDNLNEMSWAVGEVLDSLKDNGLDTKTFVLFMSDHGPHRELCLFGGSTAGLKGGKANSFEGGFRIPAISWMPGTVPKGHVSTAVLSSLDILPSIINMVSPNKPFHIDDRILDGIDVTDYLIGQKLDSALELTEIRPIYFYCNKHLMAVRYKQYKIHYFTSPLFDTSIDGDVRCPQGVPLTAWFMALNCNDTDLTKHNPPLIFDLHKDPFELYSLNYIIHSEMLQTVNSLVKKHKNSIIQVPQQLDKYNPEVVPCCNPPKCTCNYP